MKIFLTFVILIFPQYIKIEIHHTTIAKVDSNPYQWL